MLGVFLLLYVTTLILISTHRIVLPRDVASVCFIFASPTTVFRKFAIISEKCNYSITLYQSSSDGVVTVPSKVLIQDFSTTF